MTIDGSADFVDADERSRAAGRERVMKLIVLTTKIDGKKMYANPQQICAVYPKYGDDDTTIIQFSSNSFSEVLESADAVADMIANCGERRE